MAESGEIREAVEKLWVGGNVDQAELASKVEDHVANIPPSPAN